MIIIANVKIIYEGKDITRDLSPFLTAFTFTDNSGSKADDISLTLQDKDSLWLNEWTPSKADTISADIISDNVTLHCGEFHVDQIDYSLPPHTLTIKAVSVSVSGKARYEKHNKAWENITLSAIANDIANQNDLTLFYDAADYDIERREQIHMADLPFIESLCSSFGLNVKVSDGKLIVYSESDYEAHDSVSTITPESNGLLSAKFTSKSAKIFRKARVKYHHPVKNETYEAEYEDENEEGSEEDLEIYTHVDSQAQAESVAKESLAKNNSKEITANITMTGSPDFLAGTNITLSGFGMFSGKYSAETVTHNLSSGWTVSLSLKMGGSSKSSAKKHKAKSAKKILPSGGELLADDSLGY